MIFKPTIPALVAAFALGGAGAAFAVDLPGAVTYGAGVATAGPQGAVAGGVTAGKSTLSREDRRAKRDERRSSRAGASGANSASTYGSGAVSTTRNSANAGVTTGGSASGSGAQSTGSTVDAYGETTRDGSNADIYGDSTATSGDQQ